MKFAESRESVISTRASLLYFACALGIALLVLWFGQRQFGAYDGSMLVDAGWRMSLGQQPYRDFPTLLPPLFLLTAGWSVRLFGDHWRSFTLGGDCVYLLVAGLGWLLVRLAPAPRRPAERAQLLAVFLLAVSVPQLMTGHVWHSTETSMLAVTLLLGFALHGLGLVDGAGAASGGFSAVVVVVSALLWLGKPNLAVPGEIVCLFFALYAARRWTSLLFWLRTVGMGAAGACGLLALCGISPKLVAQSYVQVSDRPGFALLLGIFLNHVESLLCYGFVLVTPLLLLWGVWLYRENPRLRVGIPLVLAGSLLTVMGLMTDWDVRTNDMGPMVFAVGFAATNLFPAKVRAQRVFHAALYLLLAQMGLSALWNGAQRTRMYTVGLWSSQSTRGLETRDDPFFGRFAATERFWEMVIDPIDRDVRAHGATNVFFGVRLEFDYARYHVASPRLLPIWWHRGSSYPAGMEDRLVDRWVAHRFETVYLTDSDRLPTRLKAEIGARYALAEGSGKDVRIWRLRPDKP